MRILVTGSRGMLGSDLMQMLGVRDEMLGCDLHNCNILEEAQIQGMAASFRPEVVIHTAAYTNVDRAETDRDAALALNETGTRHVALAAHRNGARLIHISTDYVFSGTKTSPYLENDPPQPTGWYGETKFRAEQQAQQIFGASGYLIVRIAWLYGKHGKNFVSTMLRLAQQQKPLRVVNDQTGSPTYTKTVVRAIQALLDCDLSGVVHVVNSGTCTWYEFTQAILELTGITGVGVVPITTEELGRPAPRPKFSVLDTSKFTATTGQTLPHWKEGLREYLEESIEV